jgi:hypothetical protein
VIKMGYKEDIKEFRVAVDENIQRAGNFLKSDDNPVEDCTRRMQIVQDKLAEAKMWLGKCLEAFGSELPAEFRDKAKSE